MGLYDRDYMREKREAAHKQEKPDRARKLFERHYSPSNTGKPKNRSQIWKVSAGWLLALGLLSLMFQQVLDFLQNPNRNVALTSTASGVQEVRLKRNRQGHYVATGRINGQEVVFMLDTGATTVSVPEKLAQRLGLARGAAQTHQTAAGPVTGYRTVLDSVDVGGIVLRNVRASINPAVTDPQVLLGMSFLSKVEFAQQGKTLVLRKHGTE
jgi:aspartyl protease family protein